MLFFVVSLDEPTAMKPIGLMIFFYLVFVKEMLLEEVSFVYKYILTFNFSYSSGSSNSQFYIKMPKVLVIVKWSSCTSFAKSPVLITTLILGIYVGVNTRIIS